VEVGYLDFGVFVPHELGTILVLGTNLDPLDSGLN